MNIKNVMWSIVGIFGLLVLLYGTFENNMFFVGAGTSISLVAFAFIVYNSSLEKKAFKK